MGRNDVYQYASGHFMGQLESQLGDMEELNGELSGDGRLFNPIGRSWMLQVSPGRYKEAPAAEISSLVVRHPNLNAKAKKEAAAGLQNPEGLREWSLKKSKGLWEWR